MGISGGSSKSNASKSNKSKVSAEEIAAKAMAAVKEATASSVLTSATGMIKISETRRFAGKNITVEREVSKESRDAKRAQANPVGKKKEGLDAVLEQIAPAKKVTVMDKSKSDWKEFKTTDDQILEELEAHKKSGGDVSREEGLLGGGRREAVREGAGPQAWVRRTESGEALILTCGLTVILHEMKDFYSPSKDFFWGFSGSAFSASVR